jgi:hypothetical protein
VEFYSSITMSTRPNYYYTARHQQYLPVVHVACGSDHTIVLTGGLCLAHEVSFIASWTQRSRPCCGAPYAMRDDAGIRHVDEAQTKEMRDVL